MPLKDASRLPLQREVVRKQNRSQRLRLGAFRGENRFQIGAGNLAHGNPAEAADKRTDKNEIAASRTRPNDRKRTNEDFADANELARSMFVYRAIGGTIFLDCQPTKSPDLKRISSPREEF
jgi:hypothetical protein